MPKLRLPLKRLFEAQRLNSPIVKRTTRNCVQCGESTEHHSRLGYSCYCKGCMEKYAPYVGTWTPGVGYSIRMEDAPGYRSATA